VSSGIPYYPQQLAGFKIIYNTGLKTGKQSLSNSEVTYGNYLVQIDNINTISKKK